MPRAVRWEVDGRIVAETTAAYFDWPLQRGEHQVRAWVSAADGVVKPTRVAAFTVR
jgi:hypothetical protein